MPPANETRPKPKEDLVKAFAKLRDSYQGKARHFDKLRAQAAELDPKLEPVEDCISTEGTDEEVGARYRAWLALKQRNAKSLEKYHLAYDSLSQQLEETRSLPSEHMRVNNREDAPSAECQYEQNDENQEQEQEQEVKPRPQLTDANIETTPASKPSNSKVTNSVSSPSRLRPLTGIHFDEVYRNGEADPKDCIVEYPKDSGTFYIFRCNVCTLAPFAYADPMRAAGKHLDTATHGFMRRSKENAINNLGIPVLKCTKTLARKNNEAYKSWFDSPEVQKARKRTNYKISTKNVTTREKSLGKKRSLRDTDFDESLVSSYTPAVSKRRKVAHLEPCDIKAGEIYCFNSKSSFKIAIVILPLFDEWPDWRTEVLRTPKAMGCWSKDAHKLPPADLFEVDPATNEPTDWARDFRLGGPRVQRRKYLAIFIDGEQWSEPSTSIDWVSLSDIGPYEEAHLRDEERKGARDYIRQRDAARRRHEGIESGDEGGDQAADSHADQVDVDDSETEQSNSDEELPVEEKRLFPQGQSPLDIYESPRRDSETPRAEAGTQARIASSALSQVFPDSAIISEKDRELAATPYLRENLSDLPNNAMKHERDGNKDSARPLLGSRSPNESRRFGKRSFGGILNTSSAPMDKFPEKTQQFLLSSDDDDDDDDDIPNANSPVPRIESDIASSQTGSGRVKQSRPSHAFRPPIFGRF